MKMKEALDAALCYLEGGNAEINPLIPSDERIGLLTRCANTVVKEIAAEYLPLEAEETVRVRGGAFEYGALRHRCREILRVVRGGLELRFRQQPFSCAVPDIPEGEARVTYRYVPRDARADEPIELSPLADLPALAQGICAEYCLATGLYEQSAVFYERFCEGMRSAVRGRERSVKTRRWA